MGEFSQVSAESIGISRDHPVHPLPAQRQEKGSMSAARAGDQRSETNGHHV
jgi:hypothetical protein